MRRLYLAALLLPLVAMQCTSYVKGRDPQLELEVAGDHRFVRIEEVQQKEPAESCSQTWLPVSTTACCPKGYVSPDGIMCYESFSFLASPVEATKKSIELVVSNSGEAPLTVENVYFEEGGNEFLSLEWKQPAGPEMLAGETLDPGSKTDVVRLMLTYAPVTGVVNMTPTKLVIVSDDPRFEGMPFENKYSFMFTMQGKGPDIQVDKTEVKFACVTTASTTEVLVDNVGTETLIVSKIDFAQPSTEFQLANPPALPVEIPAAGSPTYKRLSFSVRYDPGDSDYNDTNSLEIFTNDMNEPEGKLTIPIKVKQSPALVEYSTDSPFTYLDFSQQDTHKYNIYNKAASECDQYCAHKGECCGCAFILQKAISYDPPDANLWYTVTPKDPTDGHVLALPMALKGGKALEFEIKYGKPMGETADKNGRICFPYEAPLVGAGKTCVDVMSVSQCEFAIAPSSMNLQFNSASPSDVKEKPVVLINSGTAACTLSHVETQNAWATGPSEDFSLDEVIPGDTKIPGLSLFPIWIQYSPHSQTPDGKLGIEYVDDAIGVVKTAVILKGTKEQDCVVPVADPGTPAQYESATAGESVTLDACGSHAGDCGNDPYEKGYVWYLLSKPDESGAELDWEGSCLTQFVPDLPGTYELALYVYEGEKFLQSDIQVLTLEVKAAP